MIYQSFNLQKAHQ